MTYNINNAVDYNSFKDIDFDMAFAPVGSVSDLNKAIAAGTLFEKFRDASAGHRDNLTYLDIAQVVHVIRAITANNALADEVRTLCTKQNITVWQDKKDADKNKPANVFQQYVMLLRGKFDGTDTTLSSSWKNNLRVVRHLIEEKIPNVDIVAYIVNATEVVGGETKTKLEALKAKDTAKHPSSTKGATLFNATKPYKSAKEAARLTTVQGIDAAAVPSYEGFRVVLVRDGANDNHDVVAVVADEDLVKKVIRAKFA